MTNTLNMVRVAEEIARPEYYHLPSMIFKSGPQAFFGWIGMLIVPLAAAVVILHHLLVRGCHTRGTIFFQLSIGIGTALLACVSVALVLKRLPRIDAWAFFGLTATAASIALIAGGLLMIRP